MRLSLTRFRIAGKLAQSPLDDPIAIAHLKGIQGAFDERVFPWNKQYRKLWPIFQEMQQAAKLGDGSPLKECGKNGWYGFHDLRRAFATLNAQQMDLFELQGLMQHKSLETTRQYVNMATRLNQTVKGLFVPDVTGAVPKPPETA